MPEKDNQNIIVGDRLKREKDGEVFEVKDIFKDILGNEYFSFFGFVVKHRKNLKRHFKNNYGKLEIYTEVTV